MNGAAGRVKALMPNKVWDRGIQTSGWVIREPDGALLAEATGPGVGDVLSAPIARPVRGGSARHARTAEACPPLWGIDLGGTEIEGVVIEPARSYRLICRSSVPAESELGYGYVARQVCKLVEQMESVSGVARPGTIGIAIPDGLSTRRVARDLARRLGVDVRLANAAKCFALAEATAGAAQGRAVVVGLILGTSVGSGIVVHDRVIHGLHGIAGQWVRAVSLGDIERLASHGDSGARETVGRLRDKFGEAVAALINVLDPDAIVIGGPVGKIETLYEPETHEAVRRHLFIPDLRTEFLKPELGESARVLGAALLTSP